MTELLGQAPSREPAAGADPSAVATFRPGAEALLVAAQWRGRAIVEKRRVAKAYRHPVLDAKLRRTRTRDEAVLLLGARRAGVRVPVVYDCDVAAHVLRLEHVPGPTLQVQLAVDDAARAAARLQVLGAMVGRLHAGGLTHGDLTTSNVLVPDPQGPGLVLIDFGLGELTPDSEARGVDLHLIEEALQATEPRADALVAAFAAGYRAAFAGAEATMKRLGEIRERGRYR